MQDVATVFVPRRLKLTVTLVSVQQAISVNELGYDQPTDQAEVLQKFVSGRDVFISLPTGSGKSQTVFTCVSLSGALRAISCIC